MPKRRILVLLGEEYTGGMARALADAYEKGARAGGHEVRRINIGELHFDPLLHHGYRVIQELEPDLKKVQEDVKWCEHLVVAYPNWWSTMPAILKGLFDRMWLPAFAFRFHKTGGYTWDKLLSGRSARVIITMNANPMLERFAIGDYSNEIRRGILKFAGFSPVALSCFGPAEKATPEKKEEWCKEMEALGKEGR